MEKTKKLVKKYIKGNRKGLDERNYLHSYRVYDILKESGYDDDICIAGLLHDILEDSVITEDNLKDLGYSDKIIGLVKACSHNNNISDSFDRRKDIMDRISNDNNEEALIIKIADFTDNMETCCLLKPERYYNFVYKKAPYIMELIYKHLDYADFDVSPLKNLFFDSWNDNKLLYSGKYFD